MSLLNIPIPNLLNGVSQQPPNLRFPTQCEIQENAYSSIVEGLGKRPPSESVIRISGSIASSGAHKVHGIDRGDNTERYIVTLNGLNNGSQPGISIHGVNGTQYTVYYPTGDQAAIRAYLQTADPVNDLKLVSVGDYTFILNTIKTTALGNSLSTAQANEALVWVKQGANGTKYTVSGSLSSTYTTANAIVASSNPDGTEAFTNIAPSETGFIAANLRAGLTAGGYTISREAYVIHILRTSSTAFTLEVSDGISSSGLGLVKGSVSSFTDLPLIAQHDMIVKVAGLPDSPSDDYWVQFKANNGSGLGDGLWQECSGPAQKNDFDYSTMPLVLIRQSNGLFLLKMADGVTPSLVSNTLGSSVPGIPANADYSNAKWYSRAAGDDNTNPAPSFVGSTLSDIFLFRGRLGFISGESVILSETGEFFNFWRTTVTQVLDSDPIDISSSYPAVTLFRHAVPFSDRLVLFSDKTQFVLTTRQAILTGSNVTLTPVSNYDILPDCRPVPVNDGIFFPFDRGSYSGMREMTVNVNDSEQLTAPDISAHIPKYIPGLITTIACSSHDNVMACVTSGDPSSIYIYKWYDSDNERVQSSWSKWIFKTAQIKGAVWMGSSLYVVLWRKHSNVPPFGIPMGYLYLEKITVEPNRKDQYSKFITTVDRRITPTTATYNAATNQTTLDVAYPIGPDAALDPSLAPVVILKATNSTEAGYFIPVVSYTDINSGPGTDPFKCNIVVPGNVSAASVWVGIPYSMKYRFSQPYLKQSDGSRPVAIASGRFQVRNMNLVYDNSSNFIVNVSYRFGGAQYSYPWSGNILGTGQAIIGDVPVEAGSVKIPIYGKNNEIYVDIENNSHLPSNFLSAEIEASYDSRSRRV